MRALGRTTLECNASVDLTTTEFIASGPAEQVVGFLRSVCRALADLPTDTLAVEADVLRAEGGNAAPPAVGPLLGGLHGLRGGGPAPGRGAAVPSPAAARRRNWSGPRVPP